MSLLDDALKALDRWSEWKKMREAPARIDELEKRIAELEARPVTAPGRFCNACGEKASRMTSSSPDIAMGAMGARRETWTCAACGFAEPDLLVGRMERIA